MPNNRFSLFQLFSQRSLLGGRNRRSEIQADDCPDLTPDNKKKLQEYLGRFRFDW